MMRFIKGIIIGVAGIIPGVSGSVFAVITGIYDDLILSVGRIRKEPRTSLAFLVPVVLGIGVGVLLAANPVLEVCEAYPLYSYCFFIGIMLASLFSPIKKIRALGRPSVLEILASVGCFLLVIILRVIAHISGAGNLVAIPYLSGGGDFIALIFTGFISVGLMVLPGVSGSVTLLVLGQYGTVYKAAGSPARLVKALMQGESESALAALEGAVLLIPFVIGAVLGFILASRLVSHLLVTRPKGVYVAVLGFILASSVTLFFDGVLPEISAFSGNGFMLWLLILSFLLSGVLLTLAFSGDKERI